MNRQILRLAIPNIISNISVPLLSTVDTALMGRLSELHLGAVGLGAMIFNLAYWNFGFLRMGTTGLTAQAFGKNDPSAMIITLGKALLLGIVVACTLMLFHKPLTEWSLYLMQASPDQVDLIKKYIYIRIWAAPATLGLYAFMGWFFGMQNSVYPLLITVLINGVNIALSYVLIVYYDMGITGVAYGTVWAQYIGLMVAVGLVGYKYKGLIAQAQVHTVQLFSNWAEFLNVNRDIFIRTIFLTFSFGFFYSQSSSAGTRILAINVILLQLINWMSYGIDGLAYAAESLIGRYYGARDRERFDQVIRLIFFWSLGFALLYAVAYGCFGSPIFALFTDDPNLYVAAKPYMIWMAIIPIAGFGSYMWDGIYIGLTASRSMRNSMLIAVTIYLLSYYAGRSLMNWHALWFSLTLFLLSRTLIQYWLYRKHGWELK